MLQGAGYKRWIKLRLKEQFLFSSVWLCPVIWWPAWSRLTLLRIHFRLIVFACFCSDPLVVRPPIVWPLVTSENWVHRHLEHLCPSRLSKISNVPVGFWWIFWVTANLETEGSAAPQITVPAMTMPPRATMTSGHHHCFTMATSVFFFAFFWILHLYGDRFRSVSASR